MRFFANPEYNGLIVTYQNAHNKMVDLIFESRGEISKDISDRLRAVDKSVRKTGEVDFNDLTSATSEEVRDKVKNMLQEFKEARKSFLNEFDGSLKDRLKEQFATFETRLEKRMKIFIETPKDEPNPHDPSP